MLRVKSQSKTYSQRESKPSKDRQMSNIKAKKFKVGDKVKIIASPDTLPDPRQVGRFPLHSSTLERTFIVHTYTKNIKLRELDGSKVSNDWWYDPSWLTLTDPIWLKQKDN